MSKIRRLTRRLDISISTCTQGKSTHKLINDLFCSNQSNIYFFRLVVYQIPETGNMAMRQFFTWWNAMLHMVLLIVCSATCQHRQRINPLFFVIRMWWHSFTRWVSCRDIISHLYSWLTVLTSFSNYLCSLDISCMDCALRALVTRPAWLNAPETS